MAQMKLDTAMTDTDTTAMTYMSQKPWHIWLTQYDSQEHDWHNSHDSYDWHCSYDPDNTDNSHDIYETWQQPWHDRKQKWHMTRYNSHDTYDTNTTADSYDTTRTIKWHLTQEPYDNSHDTALVMTYDRHHDMTRMTHDTSQGFRRPGGVTPGREGGERPRQGGLERQCVTGRGKERTSPAPAPPHVR